LKLDRIHLGQRTAHMEEIVTVNDEMHEIFFILFKTNCQRMLTQHILTQK
jgi:hypothetical protein